MEYKVIEEFGCAQKGDILSETDRNTVCFKVSENGSNRYMEIDLDTANDFVKAGLLLQVEDTCDCCEKLALVDDLCTTLIAKYDEDHEAMLENFSAGKIPTCVKVEAETVRFNLVKVLSKIKELINE